LFSVGGCAVNSVSVKRGRIQFPNACAVCLSPNPTWVQGLTSDQGKFSGYYVFFTTWKHLKSQIRVCETCGKKERRIQRIAQTSVFIGLIASVALSIYLDLGKRGAVLLGMVFCAPGILVSEKVGKPVRVGEYDDNSVEFRFKSAEYANQFRALNQASA
jgi:hypothetical protein